MIVIPCTKYCVATSSKEIVSVAIQCMSPYSVLISVSIYAIQYLSPYSVGTKPNHLKSLFSLKDVSMSIRCDSVHTPSTKLVISVKVWFKIDFKRL